MGKEIKELPYRLIDFFILSFWYVKLLFLNTDYALDFDLGWHLKTGEWIWQNKAIPFFDPFLASSEPRAWVCDQWLGDLILYFLHSNLGWVGSTFFVIFIFFVLFFVLIYDFCLKQSKSAFITPVVVCLSFMAAMIHLIVRPVVFSFLFFGLLLIKLNSIEIESKNTNQWLLKNSDIIKIFLVFVLWSNTHPSFFIGLFLIFLFVFSSCVEKVLKICEVPLSFIKKEILLFVSSAVATLCNPNGFNLHYSIIKLVNSSYYINLYQEWKKPNYMHACFLILASFLVIVAISWIISKEKKVYKSIFNICTVFLAEYLMFKAYRMFPYSAILLAYPASMAIKDIFNKFQIFFSKYKISKIIAEVNRIEVEGKSLAFVGTCILTISLVLYFTNSNKSNLFEPKERESAIVALQTIADTIPDGEYRVILTDMDYGSMMPYYGRGKLKAIIDDRSTLFEEDYHKMVIEKVSSKDEWYNLFNEINAEFFMIDNTSEIKPEAQKVLDVAYSNEEVTVFKRK